MKEGPCFLNLLHKFNGEQPALLMWFWGRRATPELQRSCVVRVALFLPVYVAQRRRELKLCFGIRWIQGAGVFQLLDSLSVGSSPACVQAQLATARDCNRPSPGAFALRPKAALSNNQGTLDAVARPFFLFFISRRVPSCFQPPGEDSLAEQKL